MKKEVPGEELYREEAFKVEILRDTRTGMAVCEKWTKDGRLHREDGPAVIDRDGVTGIITREVWMRDNERHREDGPAVISRKASTGQIHRSAWFRNGIHI